jgi:hypothetical protein
VAEMTSIAKEICMLLQLSCPVVGVACRGQTITICEHPCRAGYWKKNDTIMANPLRFVEYQRESKGRDRGKQEEFGLYFW